MAGTTRGHPPTIAPMLARRRLQSDMGTNGPSLIAVDIGNSRLRLGRFLSGELDRSASVAATDLEDAVRQIKDIAGVGAESSPVVIASVNDPVADRISAMLAADLPSDRLYRFGRDLPIPIEVALDDDRTVGQDRLLAALGAFSRARQACVVIDAGTAITVDFVDGTGVFQGGAIVPGLNMMLRAMHEHTAALPLMEYADPHESRGVFGKDTRHAMILGVRSAAIGAVRLLVDTYAESYAAYPRVIATGGDAARLFENDPLVEHLVPDLVLAGIAEACRLTLAVDPDGVGRHSGSLRDFADEDSQSDPRDDDERDP
jgi:type III pantothenate kinase